MNRMGRLQKEAELARGDDGWLMAQGIRELAACACKETLEFTVDMKGRTVEYCPGCGHRRVYDPRHR